MAIKKYFTLTNLHIKIPDDPVDVAGDLMLFELIVVRVHRI